MSEDTKIYPYLPYIINPRITGLVLDAQEEVVLSVHEKFRTRQQVKDLSLLFAAAPELLHALEDMIGGYEEQCCDAEVLRAAQDAIKKSKGIL